MQQNRTATTSIMPEISEIITKKLSATEFDSAKKAIRKLLLTRDVE